jgi:2-(1,2-epoxy-1,2-dihydrophenyl)acetyl-CoA isomerase
MYETLELERRGAATIISLARPDALNAWNAKLGTELLDAVQTVAADDEVRAVCITGSGRAFSSGADLRDLAARNTTPEGHLDVYTPLTTVYHPILTTVRTMPKPVIAKVNGPAAGIAASLVLSCDIVAAASSAYLLLAFVNVGLVPDGGALALVSARAGTARAAEMAMLGERIPASDARRWGLFNHVLPDHELDDHVCELLDRLSTGPTQSYAGAKRQINAWAYPRLEEQLELEARLQQERVQSPDFQEGVTAFLQKRAPRFAGA